MKTAPLTIPIPKRLAARPRWHGLPVPYIATIKPNGEADFRVTDEEARVRVLALRLCQLCGQPLGRFIFFTGGPLAAEQNIYFEPPAHLDCLLYAMQVCPFIAGKMEHAPVADVQRDNPTLHVQVDANFTTVKSDDWIIVKATDFTLIKTSRHSRTIYAQPFPVVFKTAKLRAHEMTARQWKIVGEQLFTFAG